MVGVWEPSTLSLPSTVSEPEASSDDPAADTAAPDMAAPDGPGADALPEGDDYFSVRGELIFTKPETGDLVVKIRQLPRPDGQRPTPFKLQIRGEVPLEHLRHFVSLDLRRQGQLLQMEGMEVLAPVNQRGNRGGKGRRDDRRPAGNSRGGRRAPADAAGAGADGLRAPRAVVRPGR
jgi:hypothetical protein